MGRSVGDVAREIVLALPESEEFLSHGTPTFRVRKGKSFASYTVNHHGDGRIALWFALPDGAQEMYVRADPDSFFVPPYLGPSGWVGVRLDRKLPWKRVVEIAREAWRHIAPVKLHGQLGKPLAVKPPTEKIKPEDLDPLLAPARQRVLQRLRKIVLAWPEVVEAMQYGSPVWQASKKTFIGTWMIEGRLHVAFRAGLERQGLLVADKRFRIPAYLGNQGWIALDVEKRFDAGEVEALALDCYRAVASKRALAKLMPASG